MSQDEPDLGRSEFPPTEWSLLDLIHDGGDAQQLEQDHDLEQLLSAYLPAMRAHLIHNRHCREDEADDILQAFVYRKILQGRLLLRVTRGRGRFRSFLVRSLDHFLADERRSAARRRRSPGVILSLDDTDLDAASGEEPGDVFTAAWARQIIADAIDRTRRHCELMGRSDVWTVFDARIVRPALHDEPVTDYDDLVRRLRLQSTAQASNLLVTARRMFGRYLREVVSQFVAGEAEIEEELRDLRQALSRIQRKP